MNDMSAVIVPKSDQLNADDLIAGPRTITIRDVTIRPGTEQPVSIHFDGDNGKPWKTCKSMNRVLVHAWGPDAKAYVGRSVTIYRDPNVKWGGMAVGGIRISHLSHIERDMQMALTETKGKRTPFAVKVLQQAQEGQGGETTIEDARAAIANAEDLAALKRVWLMKLMAPFRAELQAEMEERKAVLAAFETPANPTETSAQKSAILLGRIARTDELAQVEEIEAEYQATARADLNVPDQDRVEEAIEARKAALKGGK